MSKRSNISGKTGTVVKEDAQTYKKAGNVVVREAYTGKFVEVKLENSFKGKAVTGGRFSNAGVWQILSGKAVTGSTATATEKMELARKGVVKSQLVNLKERAGLDYDELADVLPATRATLLAKKGKEKFSPVVSEAIVSLADIYTYGYQVFGDEQLFNDWIREPLPALGGATPFSLLDNQFGREEVRDLIGRIAYGVYS